MLDSDNIIAIPLTQNKYAIIDAEDWDLIKNYKWAAHKWTKGNQILWYALHDIKNKVQKTTLRMHKLITKTNNKVDHKNNDGLDNRKENLRTATNAQNNHNARKKCQKIGKQPNSKYKGVSYIPRYSKWRGRITFNKQKISLGCFESEIDASRAYDKAALYYFKEFARINGV